MSQSENKIFQDGEINDYDEKNDCICDVLWLWWDVYTRIYRIYIQLDLLSVKNGF